MARRGGLIPTPRRDPLRDLILSESPTGYFELDDAAGPIRSWSGGYQGVVNSNPVFGYGGPPGIPRSIYFRGSPRYAAVSGFPNPTTDNLSVFIAFRCMTSGGYLTGKGNTGDFSWDFRVDSGTGCLRFLMSTAAGVTFDDASSVEVVTDQLWHTGMGGVDAGIAWVALDDKARVMPGGTSGTWNKTSAVDLGISSRGVASGVFTGMLARLAIWNDRVISDQLRLRFHRLAMGGT